ncbi:MAG TPA: PucR family transcriptional regulator [Pseudonocardia sp.]|nr:PucR family transcriptional regulator [Pseudonocardia sp.]
MPVTLAALLRQPVLGLTMLTGAENVPHEISWVHASELGDPTPYLDGGELLLSVGMWLDPAAGGAELAEQAEAYVRRLVEVGVVGLGFGVGVKHDEVPPALVAAAESAGLPLLQVPEQTAFVAVGRSVWEALAAEQHAEVTRTSSAQQDLTRAAVSSGAAGLLRRLAERLDGWALMLDPAGTVQHAAPAGAERRAAWLATELERFRDLSTPVSATLSVEDDQIAVQSLRLGRRTGGFLAVGSPVRLNREQRTVLNTAASLLTLMLAQTSALRAAEAQLRTAIFELLLEGDLDRAARLAGGLGGGLPADPVRLLLAAGTGRSRDDLAELLDLTIGPRARNLASAGGRVLHAAVGDRLAVLYPAAGRPRSRVLAAAALGVHRHTLRNRIRRAAGLLDRDLGSAAVRAELWVALRLLDTPATVEPMPATHPSAPPAHPNERRLVR